MHHRAFLLTLLVGVALCAGCGEDEGPCTPTALIDPQAWTSVALDEDPFAGDRSEGVVCDEEGIKIEDFGGETSLAVETRLCAFATVHQPTVADLGTCERILVRMWYFELLAPEPSEAHLALATDAGTIWEKTLPIPGPSGLIYESVPVDALPAGSELYWHVDNHGTNSYNLLEISGQP